MVISASAVLWVGLTATATLEPAGVPDRGTAYEVDKNALGLVLIGTGDPLTVRLNSVVSIPDKPTPLNLKPPIGGLRFVLFKEVPPEVKFTHGFRMQNGWAVALQELESLQIIVPSGYAFPRIILEVSFYRDKDAKTARGILMVEVMPAGSVPPSTAQEAPVLATKPVVGTLSTQEKQPAPKPRTVSADEERQEAERGNQLVKMGDIGTARLIFQNLAIRGSAIGARLLAETFDPAYLKDAESTGVLPDIETARKWYKTAADLGDNKAASQLSILAQRQ